MKLWSGRFEKMIDPVLEQFGASIQVDQVLWREDIMGTLAHIKGLHQVGILTDKELDKLVEGLEAVAVKIAEGHLEFTVEDEDIHMNIERLLFNEVGELAGKVHTGRSRNDQIALDMRLYMRRQIRDMIENCLGLQQALLTLAKNHIDIIFPGYTHLQQAQPIRLAHHWLAYFWMLARDITRLQHNFISTNKFPLGAGALAGNSFAIPQELLAKSLNFTAVYENSLDAVGDRDYLVEFLASASLIMMHLSKLCEELIIWSSQEFNFIEMDDAFCTGSSMMPQKKNPDGAELIRGKTGRVYGALFSLLTTLKGLPLAYNKDLQEDKECVFDTIKTVNNCLKVMQKMIATLKVKESHIDQAMAAGFLCATEVANYLVRKGLPFRQAHETIGKLTKYCLLNQVGFSNLQLSELKQFSDLFEEEVFALFSLPQAVEKYDNHCGTAKCSVKSQLGLAEQVLEEANASLAQFPHPTLRQVGEGIKPLAGEV